MRLIDADRSDEIIVFDKQNELLQCSVVRDYCERQREFLNKFPTVDAELVRHGYWVAKKVMARTPFAINHYCSKCKFETDFCTNYCSNCGAKMDEEAEHEAD